APPSRQPSGLLPQLLNPIDEKEAARLIADIAWLMQEKKDGHRMLIRKTGDTIQAINRASTFRWPESTTTLPAARSSCRKSSSARPINKSQGRSSNPSNQVHYSRR